jgi:hypothetical protein
MGFNCRAGQDGIEKAVEAVVDEIKGLAILLKGHEDVAHIAAISSHRERGSSPGMSPDMM